MKKTLFVFVLTISAFSLFAQQWLGETGSFGKIFRDGDFSSVKGNGPGRVSIGSLWGSSDLDWSHGYLSFNSARTTFNPTTPWEFYGDGAGNGSATIFSNIGGNIYFSVRPSTGGNSGTLSDAQIMDGIKMRLQSDGKLIIGNALGSTMTWPGNYRLYVQSGILTEKVKVSVLNSSEWADHVFHNNYKLIPLKSLETFVLTNKHLPGIPSASEVVKEGLDLGKMDAKLLEKVEELTLYIIELNKKLEKQQKQIEALKKK